MRPAFIRPLPTALAALTLLLASAAQAGSADINDEINARIARTKSLQAARSAALAGSGLASTAGVTAIGGGSAGGVSTAAGVLGNGCNIAIGNVFEDKQAGVSTSAKRETTVIVTGDVIQVGNNCR